MPRFLGARAGGLRLVPLLLIAGAASVSFSQPALAHAPPLGARILQEPSGGQLVVMNRGLVFRGAGAEAPRLLCNEALGVSTAELPSVALLSDASLLVGTSRGLRRSRDQGCTWSSVADMGALSVPAIASDPTDPDVVYVATFAAGATELRVSRDGGSEWSTALALGDGDYMRSILVAAANPAHVYATLSTFAAPDPPTQALLHSSDGGATWRRTELPWTDEDYMIAAAATDPDDPETLVLHTIAKSPGLQLARLLVSRDGGESFRVELELPEIRGAAFGADRALWVATRGGLHRGEGSPLEWEQVSAATELGCVTEHAGELLVCGHYAGVGAPGFGVGRSADGGRTFAPWLDFGSVTAPVACARDSTAAALCAQPWLDWSFELLAPVLPPMDVARGSPPPDSGEGALMSPDTTQDEADPEAMSTGCTLGFGVGPARSAWLVMLALLCLLRRRPPPAGSAASRASPAVGPCQRVALAAPLAREPTLDYPSGGPASDVSLGVAAGAEENDRCAKACGFAG